MAESFNERRKFVIERLNNLEGIKTNVPKGAFYIFPEVSSHYGKKFNGIVINDSVSFCKFMLEEMKIALVPGSAFGDDKCIRLSYAASMQNLEDGLDRLEEGLEKLED